MLEPFPVKKPSVGSATAPVIHYPRLLQSKTCIRFLLCHEHTAHISSKCKQGSYRFAWKDPDRFKTRSLPWSSERSNGLNELLRLFDCNSNSYSVKRRQKKSNKIQLKCCNFLTSLSHKGKHPARSSSKVRQETLSVVPFMCKLDALTTQKHSTEQESYLQIGPIITSIPAPVHILQMWSLLHLGKTCSSWQQIFS